MLQKPKFTSPFVSFYVKDVHPSGTRHIAGSQVL